MAIFYRVLGDFFVVAVVGFFFVCVCIFFKQNIASQMFKYLILEKQARFFFAWLLVVF